MRTAMQSSNQPKTRPTSQRRGTIIILAVGILAVLSVAALSYMTVVKLDRSSAKAYATITNFRQQVDVTTSHIGSLLTADLFGNKVVTSSTPRIDPNGDRIWPKMFEDGEYSDYPSVDTEWLADPTDPNELLYADITDPNKFLRNELVPSDDAWLAPQQPDDIDGDGFWDTWPQITNLRSGLVWQVDLGLGSDGFWRRDHGRYVSISEWLARTQGNIVGFQRGDPGLDIANFDTGLSGYSGAYAENNGDGTSAPPTGSGPNLGVDSTYLGAGATIGSNLRVFDMQMSRMHEFFNGATNDVNDISLPAASGSTLNQIDGQLWADTDGDGRADARWQQLDSHGELFGFKWVVAARIIDSSAKISANSSFEWQFPGNSDSVGYGRTPADIDLYRLLRRSQMHPDVASNGSLNLDSHYEHYRSELAWNLEAAFEEINDNFSTSIGWMDLPHDGSGGGSSMLDTMTPLDAREREMLYRTMGSAPRHRSTTKAIPMPVADEIDLRSSEGANQSLLVSKLEQRTDQQYSPGSPLGYLPGMESPAGGFAMYPNIDSLGPLRAIEERRVVQKFGNEAITPEQDFGPSGYEQVNKIERLQTDIRRHLTMVNGVGDYSPVPVVNEASTYDDQFFNRKIRIDDPRAVRDPVALPEDLDDTAITKQIRDYVQSAFESFMWALAPLASDIPTVSGLGTGDIGNGASGQSFHYGGSINGAMDSPASSFMTDPSASYATLRAASLAVNLADALDSDESINNAGSLRESPTLSRFIPTSSQGGTVVDIREVVLTPNFSHGNVPEASLIASNTGTPANGITLVGLDRQPFLKQAFYLDLFQDYDSSSMANGNLFADLFDPSIPTADDQVGSIFVVELGNPWPQDIDVQDYVIRISYGNNMDQFVAPIDVINGGSTVIPTGGSKSFFMLFETGRQGIFDAVWDAFLTEVFVQFDAKGLIRDDNLVELNPANTDVVLPLSGGPVPFLSFDSMSLPVQLIYRYPGRQHDVLVDRLSPTGGVTFPVPDMAVTLVDFPFPTPSGAAQNTLTGSARFARSNNLHRPMGQTSGSGFPSYVVERSSENVVSPAVETHSWRLSLPLVDIQDEIADPPLTGLHSGLFAIPTPGDESGMLTGLLSFQLFVPNGPLRSVAELHMLCAFAHQYIVSGFSYVGFPPADASYALSNAHEIPDPANPLGNTFTSGRWLTVSEQLGQNIHYNYDTSAGFSGNPYLGVLDPSRYILGDDLADTPAASAQWPDALRIPLANRVFDCFSVLPTARRLAQGKINLNTAPIEVLESMPFFAPESDVDGSMPGSMALDDSLAAIGAEQSRANLVRKYRDLDDEFDTTGGTLSRSDLMMPGGASGLRGFADPITMNQRRGLVNVGELLAMSDWTSNNGVPAELTPFEDFMQLGIDGAPNDGAPLSLRYMSGNSGGAVSTDFNEFGNYAGRNDYDLATFDPVDDPEERLALARSALDIASVRSDVFTAWFIIRAYDPEQIEAIQAPDALGETVRAELMNPGGATLSPGLNPVYETRWLAVFDRSEIRRPNERPRILLLVELPIN